MIREQEATAPAPARADWIDLSIVTDPIAFAGMRAEWSRLMERSAAGIFNAWDWLYPWYRRLGSDLEPWILTARDRSGELVGLMPLAMDSKHVATRPVRRVCFLGERQVGSDYLDVVAVRGREEELARTFARFLVERKGEWDLLDLTDFDERSRTPAILREVLGEGFVSEDAERFLCPNEEFLEGETFDAFLKRTSRRDNYLRRRKWLEKQKGYRIEIETDPAKLTRPLSEFFRLHAMRWEGDGGSSGINGPRVESFHRDATHLFAERGKLRLYTLWLEDEALASVYGIIHGDTFHYYQAGYDPEWRNKSVGLVLVGATFEDAISLGLRKYDFLRGTEPYKSDWVSKLRKTISFRAYPKTGTGVWYVRAEESAKQLRNVIKRALPQNAVERVRRFRRQKAAAK